MAEKDAISIIVKIGKIEITYLAYKTTATKNYDGFGTFSFYESMGERFILINAAHLDWQLNRNGSGMCKTEPLFDLSLVDFIETALFEAMQTVTD
jgi:hypothetical protein